MGKMTVPQSELLLEQPEEYLLHGDVIMVDNTCQDDTITKALETMVTSAVTVTTDDAVVPMDTMAGMTEVVLDFSGYGDVLDLSLATAAASAVQLGSVTPLIKEELKYSIQSKRLAKGKDELQVEFKAPEPEKLSDEDVVRRQRRRERNRMAAQKCRNKKKGVADDLDEQCSQLEEMNTTLKDEVARLEEERENLYSLLKSHNKFKCPVGELSVETKES